MEQMKVYEDTSFNRYEHLPMHHRMLYWVDYLDRLVQFSLHDPEISSEKHDRLLAEITRVTATIKILQNEPNNRVIESKATAKPAEQESIVTASYPASNQNIRSGRKRKAVRNSDRKSKTARANNS